MIGTVDDCAVQLALVGDLVAGKGIYGILDDIFERKVRRVGICHEFLGRLYLAAAAEILDQKDRSIGLTVQLHADVILDQIREILQMEAVIRNDNDPGIVIAAVGLKVFEPFADDLIICHIALVMPVIHGISDPHHLTLEKESRLSLG